MRTCRVSLGLLVLLLPGCAKQAGHGTVSRSNDCQTLQYEARSLAGSVQVPQSVSVGVESSTRALREVDQWVEQYYATWKTACVDYKNGALTREEYRDETQRIRMSMEKLQAAAQELNTATDAASFEAALKRTWTAAAPADQRVDLEVELTVMAQRPGDATFEVAPLGAILPSGTRLYTQVRLSERANVSIYQINPRGERVVLFPNAAGTTTNPLPAASSLRLPAHGHFELDDHDLGFEDLHVVVSPDESVVQPPPPGQAPLCGQRGLTFVADSCPRTRGLVFKPDATAGTSLSATNAAAERGVHLVYSFQHVGSQPGADTPPALPGNFDVCPDGTSATSMAAPDGSYERWCVQTTPQGHHVGHGPYRKWRADGVPWIRGALRRGQRVGTWETFDASGAPQTTVQH